MQAGLAVVVNVGGLVGWTVVTAVAAAALVAVAAPAAAAKGGSVTYVHYALDQKT